MKTKTTTKTVTVDGAHRLRCIPWYDASTGRRRVRVTYLGLKKGSCGVIDLRDERMRTQGRTLDTVYTIDSSTDNDDAVTKAVEMFRNDNGI